jgi:hypothetical protein
MGIFPGKRWILGATFGATEAKQRCNNVMTLNQFVSLRIGELVSGK